MSQNNVVHNPLETLQTILELIREIQELPDLYRLFIKEQSENTT